jgi:hypothetical protein
MRHTWIILLVVIVAALLLSSTHVRQNLGWMDSISGTQKSQTVWRFGVASAPAVSESPLAARYRKLGLTWQPDWRNVKGTYVSLFGRHIGSGHGPAPMIYPLASADVQQSYLAASSDDDIREFFRVMSSGTEQEQKAAVEAACDKALGESAATRPGG